MMKNITNIKYLLPVILAGLFASCKDSYPQPDFSNGTPIIELPSASLAGDGEGNSMSQSFDIQSTPSDYYIIVNYAAENANPTDVNVTLAVDTATLYKYNSIKYGTDSTARASYAPQLPDADYSLLTNITIPKGARKVEYHIKFNTTLIDPSQTFALPLKIVKASSGIISGNFGTMILLVNVKNAYDGNYSIKGTIVRNSSTGPDTVRSGNLKSGLTTRLATLSATSNSFSQYWKDGSSVGGVDKLYVKVDQATNKVTVASTSNATVKNTTGYDNRYDPATKTYYLSFNWGSGLDTRSAVDTLVYTGP